MITPGLNQSCIGYKCTNASLYHQKTREAETGGLAKRRQTPQISDWKVLRYEFEPSEAFNA